MSVVHIAAFPMVARVHTTILWGGSKVAELSFNPLPVILTSVHSIYFVVSFVISEGVHHAMSPFQYSSTSVSGVPPEYIWPK